METSRGSMYVLCDTIIEYSRLCQIICLCLNHDRLSNSNAKTLNHLCPLYQYFGFQTPTSLTGATKIFYILEQEDYPLLIAKLFHPNNPSLSPRSHSFSHIPLPSHYYQNANHSLSSPQISFCCNLLSPHFHIKPSV